MTGMAMRAFDRVTSTRIARAFLPHRWFGNRWHYYYSRAKLSSDPLYPGVTDALRGSDAPLLDLGCGIGLLAHALRATGVDLPYRGLDNDAAKIAQAQQAAGRAGLHAVAFDVVDLAAGIPVHRGSVTLLDVLQFVPPEAQQQIVDAAIAMLSPGSRLVIRTGLDDGSRRARVTRTIDAFSRLLGWMNSGPKRYPSAEALRTKFDAAGLQSQFTALYGSTPFNNWLVVATR